MIVVVGSINMDLVVQVASHPRAGETLQGSDYTLHPGGKGGNQAVAAARAGGPTRLIAKAGIDEFGDTLLDSIAAAAVDIHAVQRVARPSGVAFINVTPDGENSITVSPGANAALEPDDLDPALFEGASVVLTQLEIPTDTAVRALELGRQAGAVTIVNLSPSRNLLHEQLRDADMILANRAEAADLLGDTAPGPDAGVSEHLDTARRLARLAGMAVLTLGAEGACWSTADRAGHVEAIPVEAIDTTGAGDAFAGALATSLAEGHDLEAATRFGVAAGALAVLRQGAQPSMPRREEIDELMAGRMPELEEY